MDCVMGFSLSASKTNAIWVIIDQLTKSARFLPIGDTWRVKKLAQLYANDFKPIFRKHFKKPEIDGQN